MGMDVFHYRIEKLLNKEEFNPEYNGEFFDYCDEKIITIILDKRMKDWFLQSGLSLDFIRNYKEFDWNLWLKRFPQYNPKSTQYKGWIFEDYRLRGDKKDWMHIVKETDSSTETEIIKAGFNYIEKEVIFLKVEEIGYMRKPFRHSDIPTRSEGNNLVITVTNFSDKGLVAQEIMKKVSEEQTDSGNLFVFEKEVLNQLAECSYEPKFFNEIFIQNFKSKDLVLFNW